MLPPQGDTICRACAAATTDVCPACSEKLKALPELCPSRIVQRQVQKMQCHCPNRGLGCAALIGVLDVEHHLGAECEWREEACDLCHQQVRRAEMARHKDTTCARKPMSCGYADVGCPTRCPQEVLPDHERDGMAAHMGLLRQCLAGTSLELAQTRHELTQCREELGGQVAATKAELTGCQAELAQTKHSLEALRAFVDQAPIGTCTFSSPTSSQRSTLCSLRQQLITPPAAPEGLEARWDEATNDVALEWRPLPSAAASPASADAPSPPGPPVRYRVHVALVVGGKGAGDDGGLRSGVVYLGPECRCRYRFPPGATPGFEAHCAVVAMRGLAESGPSATAICTHPDIVFTYDHDMDERGLFYFIGTQGRTQPWRNPAEAGWVNTIRSSDCGFGRPSDIVGREACNSLTDSQPNSWWYVHLCPVFLFRPTHYTLRHSNYPSYVEHRLQSWRLEGSVDGAEGSWRTLDEHTNEPNAIPARADAMATFAVAPDRAFPARLFRVLMTGPSPCGRHYLVLSGLEIHIASFFGSTLRLFSAHTTPGGTALILTLVRVPSGVFHLATRISISRLAPSTAVARSLFSCGGAPVPI
ncbi:putative E3 ubiquitin-protein ligase HECTD1 [Paratrimastix pyriformis]|uniref:E3 ubiquitin-protein ligase HECTD1 n=1 Tax=Paratrimastix pyriformis TaxID=342808 RepID=A0ABQ8U930_9EUKA|nr:putative E3 ubiquitin-protein ligase HECTD1 [Paratrimastix pyriformis]